MNKYFISFLSFVFGCFVTYIFLTKEEQKNEVKQSQIVVEQIKSLKKLIVTEGIFSDTFTYKDTKNYMYDMFQFEKETVAIINAKVQVSYDLSLLEVEIDEGNKTLFIKKIPEPVLEIIPNIRYFNMRQSTFNTFSGEDFNKLQKEAIKRISETSESINIKKRAKEDLFKELNKIYILTDALDWKIINETSLNNNNPFKD